MRTLLSFLTQKSSGNVFGQPDVLTRVLAEGDILSVDDGAPGPRAFHIPWWRAYGRMEADTRPLETWTQRCQARGIMLMGLLHGLQDLGSAEMLAVCPRGEHQAK